MNQILLQFVAMENSAFEYNEDSEMSTVETPRNPERYRTVNVKPRYCEYAFSFLDNLARILMFVRSISFVGTFSSACIRNFFRQVRGMGLDLQHITIMGDIKNMHLIMKTFASIERFESVTFSDVRLHEFSSAFRYVRAKKLVLINIRLEGLRKLPSQENIEQLELRMIDVDATSRDFLLNSCPKLREVISDGCPSAFIGAIERNSYDELIHYGFCETETFDWLVRLPDVARDLVLQYIENLDELLSLSEVSQNWFGFTKRCIERKARYNLDPSGVRQSRPERKRNYSSIYAVIPCRFTIDTLQSSANHLIELTLEVRERGFNRVKRLLNEIEFPRLAYLDVVCCITSELNGLKLPETLKTAKMSNFKCAQSPEVNESLFFQSLTRARNLTELHIFDTVGMEKFFSRDASACFPFQLQSLTLPIRARSLNFEKFLLSQRISLAYLSLSRISPTLMRTIFDSFELTSFKFLEYTGDIDVIRAARPMESLLEFQMPIVAIENPVEKLGPYFNLAPRMQKLHIQKVTETLLTHLSENFQDLTEVHYWEGENIEDLELRFQDFELIEHDLPFEEHDAIVFQMLDAQ